MAGFRCRADKYREAAEVLAIDLASPTFYERDRPLLDARDAFRICSTLVTISGDSTLDQEQDVTLYYEYSDYYHFEIKLVDKPQNETMGLAHLSVKDYLLSERIKLGKTTDFSLNAESSKIFIAQTFLAYSTSPPFSIGHCSREETQ